MTGIQEAIGPFSALLILARFHAILAAGGKADTLTGVTVCEVVVVVVMRWREWWRAEDWGVLTGAGVSPQRLELKAFSGSGVFGLCSEKSMRW